MREIKRGNIWEQKADVYVIPTCGVITKAGALVMGAGAALGAKKRFPSLPMTAALYFRSQFGLPEKMIRMRGKKAETYNGFVYGFVGVIGSGATDKTVGLFQTKIHYSDPARLSLIGHAIVRMNAWLKWLYGFDEFPPNPKVVMCFPGIGLGGLRRESVLPLLEDLDPSVEIYEL